MIDWSNLFDSYSRQARLYPALLAILPAVGAVIALTPGVIAETVTGSLIAAAVACGAAYLLADIARSAGRRHEPKLFSAWGGVPTTIWLRHSSDFLDAATKERRHEFLAANIPGFVPPTRAEEGTDLYEADQRWSSAVHWLREQCRGADYALVQRENANYGFRRNMYGVRPYGVLLALTSLLAMAAFGYSDNPTAVGFNFGTMRFALSKMGWAALGIAVGSAAAWMSFVTERWVRSAAEAYAYALLACCERLPDKRA